ncbi:tetratricopeptide repeat protein [Streptomyces sp. NPDC058470]|uniref:tetratricopeptide repeat protein n=1 Tax=Streptomyces sp. NPDC058470 TaxID=3346515 RepID=UPI00364FA111
MSRLSREQKRELKRRRAEEGADSGEYLDPAVTPVEVRVPAGGAAPGGGVASVGGVPVFAAPGQTVQAAVLDHLHRLALTTGRPVLAAIHDERTGFVVPIQVYVDGSSTYVGEPRRFQPHPQPESYQDPQPQSQSYQDPNPQPQSYQDPNPQPQLYQDGQPQPQAQSYQDGQSHSQPQSYPDRRPHSHPPEPAAGQVRQPPMPPPPPPPVPSMQPSGTPPVPPAPPVDPVWPAAPTDPAPSVLPPSAFALRTLPEPKGETPPGVAGPPTGEFGPPPDLAPVRKAARSPIALNLDLVPDSEPEPKPAPVRGFDAVAEAVLAPVPEGAGEAAFLSERVTRINEAVQEGRIEEAAGMAERAVAEAAQTLGPEHPEALRVRELTAYIAYLGGDAPRSFRLSLDLARVHRRHRDPDAAYGNVQSAATAWRAVRDPSQGLDLGRDLIGVWTELTADGGPAADDIEQLEKTRTRMGRLTERARSQSD